MIGRGEWAVVGCGGQAYWTTPPPNGNASRGVELAIEEHPEVTMAAVISIPDPTFQEVGIAYVTGSSGSSPDADVVRSFVKERLANYKVPKEIIVLDDLPMMPHPLRAEHQVRGDRQRHLVSTC